jgi:hypothetical protein
MIFCSQDSGDVCVALLAMHWPSPFNRFTHSIRNLSHRRGSSIRDSIPLEDPAFESSVFGVHSSDTQLRIYCVYDRGLSLWDSILLEVPAFETTVFGVHSSDVHVQVACLQKISYTLARASICKRLLSPGIDSALKGLQICRMVEWGREWGEVHLPIANHHIQTPSWIVFKCFYKDITVYYSLWFPSWY